MTNWTNAEIEAERALRIGVRGGFTEWAVLALAAQGQVPARHHRVMIRELEAAAAGECDRLMLLLPPGSAKSTYASLLFPAWFLARHPGAHVIGASHTAGLAAGFGRGVRGLLLEHRARLGVGVDALSRAAHRFGTTSGGTYYATGVRGPVTGRRADLVVIDDPVKGHAEADSRLQRDALWDWYRSDLLTRLRPGGRIVLVMTRWHPDDLGGRLLAGAEAWRVVRLPAIAEAGDTMGRAPGEALWPEWEDLAALERKRLAMGDRAWGGAVPAVAAGGGRAVVPGGAGGGFGGSAAGGGGAGVGFGGELCRGLDGGGAAGAVRGRGVPGSGRRAAEGRAGGGGASDPGDGGAGRHGGGGRAAAGPRPGGAVAGGVFDGAAGGLAGGELAGERGEGRAGDAGGVAGERGDGFAAGGCVERGVFGGAGGFSWWGLR